MTDRDPMALWSEVMDRLEAEGDQSVVSQERMAIEILGVPPALLPEAPAAGGDRGTGGPVKGLLHRLPTPVLILGLLLGSAGLFALIGAIGWAVERFAPPPAFYPAILHVVVVAFFLRRARRQRSSYELLPEADDSGPAPSRISLVWRQFVDGWTALWVSFLALYAWMAVHECFFGREATPSVLVRASHAVLDLLNLATSFSFFYLYLVLDKPAVRDSEEPDKEREFHRSVMNLAFLTLPVAGVAIADRLGVAVAQTYGSWVVSVYAAVSMMYFVAGLRYVGYRDIEIRRRVLLPLFAYCILQVHWSAITRDAATREPWMAPVFLTVALVLKAYLFVLVSAWIEDRKLESYLRLVQHIRNQDSRSPEARAKDPAVSGSASRTPRRFPS
jgi:hypothetical protein